jgi:hypothetical protein
MLSRIGHHAGRNAGTFDSFISALKFCDACSRTSDLADNGHPHEHSVMLRSISRTPMPEPNANGGQVGQGPRRKEPDRRADSNNRVAQQLEITAEDVEAVAAISAALRAARYVSRYITVKPERAVAQPGRDHSAQSSRKAARHSPVGKVPAIR